MNNSETQINYTIFVELLSVKTKPIYFSKLTFCITPNVLILYYMHRYPLSATTLVFNRYHNDIYNDVVRHYRFVFNNA